MNTETIKPSFFHRLIRMKSFWFVVWLALFSYPVYRSLNRTLPPPLPIYYQLPEFKLVNDFGKPFGSEELKGRFYIASFAFTSCPTTCPPLMDKLELVQKRIRGVGQKAAIVTFTVDPEVDTPEVLFKYARKRHANPAIWHFLTGTEQDLRKIVIDGFKVPMGNKEQMNFPVGDDSVTLFDIAHTEKLALIDDQGRVRGYYGTDKKEMDRMMIDLGLLVNNSFSNAEPRKVNTDKE